MLNGIWDVGRGLQLSGLYFYGSGMRTGVSCGSCQVRDTGQAGGTRRRDDGSIIERNSFVGTALHRVDMRLQQRIRLGGRRSLDGIFEVFNLFDYQTMVRLRLMWTVRCMARRYTTPTSPTGHDR